jgi:hypothetical protein
MEGFIVGIINKLRKKFEYRDCFHKDDDCTINISNSHSLSKKRILSNIADNGQVLCFDRNDKLPKKVGYGKATTFKGFCKKHDAMLFEIIDNHNYEPGNKKQEFLFAYRALAKIYNDKIFRKNIVEYIYKLLINRNYDELKQFCDSGNITNNLDEVTQYVSLELQGIDIGVRFLENLKVAMNVNLDKEKYYTIQTYVIELDKEYPIASSSGITLDRDLNGLFINDYASPLKPVYLTLFPQINRTYILLSYHQEHKNTFRFIEGQILRRSLNEQKAIISNIVACYVDNFVFSPTYWDNYQQKDLFIELFKKYINDRPNSLLPNKYLNMFWG